MVSLQLDDASRLLRLRRLPCLKAAKRYCIIPNIRRSTGSSGLCSSGMAGTVDRALGGIPDHLAISCRKVVRAGRTARSQVSTGTPMCMQARSQARWAP